MTRRAFAGTLVALPLTATACFADAPLVYNTAGYAIQGFDPVAYFREGQPLAGSDDYRLMWHKAIWRFSTAQNMAMFERNPKRFAPQYGGYCARTLAMGQIESSTPQAWVLRDDKLFLMHSETDRDLWQSDPARYIAMANSHWPAALGTVSAL